MKTKLMPIFALAGAALLTSCGGTPLTDAEVNERCAKYDLAAVSAKYNVGEATITNKYSNVKGNFGTAELVDSTETQMIPVTVATAGDFDFNGLSQFSASLKFDYKIYASGAQGLKIEFSASMNDKDFNLAMSGNEIINDEGLLDRAEVKTEMSSTASSFTLNQTITVKWTFVA